MGTHCRPSGLRLARDFKFTSVIKCHVFLLNRIQMSDLKKARVLSNVNNVYAIASPLEQVTRLIIAARSDFPFLLLCPIQSTYLKVKSRQITVIREQPPEYQNAGHPLNTSVTVEFCSFQWGTQTSRNFGSHRAYPFVIAYVCLANKIEQTQISAQC